MLPRRLCHAAHRASDFHSGGALMFARLLRFASCLVSAIAVPAHAGDVPVFAQRVTSSAKEIVSYPVGNPSAMTVVGAQADTLVGMDFNPEATVLWALDFTTQQIGTVNPMTAVFVPTATLQGPCCFNSFTINPVSGVFYGSLDNNETVYSIDPLSGQSALQGVAAAAGWAISALAIDCNGRGISSASNAQGDERLFRWRVGTSAVLIGNTGHVHATSLEFDNADGSLYAWFGTTTSSTHAKVDPVTAQTSQESLLEGRYRMAIRSACPSDRIFANGFDPAP